MKLINTIREKLDINMEGYAFARGVAYVAVCGAVKRFVPGGYLTHLAICTAWAIGEQYLSDRFVAPAIGVKDAGEEPALRAMSDDEPVSEDEGTQAAPF